MARLEPALKSKWKESLHNCAAPWVLLGIRTDGPVPERVDGMAGLIDWHVHGQVSELLAQDRLESGEFCMIPGAHGKPSFLIYHFARPDSVEISRRLKKLNLTEVCVAESTFPEDFLREMKQNFKKEGIRCTKLEPVTG